MEDRLILFLNLGSKGKAVIQRKFNGEKLLVGRTGLTPYTVWVPISNLLNKDILRILTMVWSCPSPYRTGSKPVSLRALIRPVFKFTVVPRGLVRLDPQTIENYIMLNSISFPVPNNREINRLPILVTLGFFHKILRCLLCRRLKAC